MKKIFLSILFCLFTAAFAGCDEDLIVAPKDQGLVFGDCAKVIIDCNGTPEINGKIKSRKYYPDWEKERFGNRWIANFDLPGRGNHTLLLKGKCGGKKVESGTRFNNSFTSIEIAEKVIERFFSKNRAEKLAWNWGPAVFLYGLSQIAENSTKSDEYLSYLKKYHQNYIDKGTPKIDLADKCAAALSGYVLYKKYGDDRALPNVEKVINYIKNEERNEIGSIDHLGTESLEQIFFPSSIWIDSLMMWGLLTVKYGLNEGDDEFADFGLGQPLIFKSKLKDYATGLFFHAWNVPKDQPYPVDNTFWLRGNGWALVSTIEIISELDPGNEYYYDLVDMFVDLAESIAEYRQTSGYWDTVVTDPGYAYEESSGSALVAFAFAKGARMGYLPAHYRELARDTFNGIASRMVKRDPGYTMEEISKGTNPMNKPGYKIIMKDRNINYGVGALLLLANELAF